jgi:hypothetical protein
MYFWLDRTRFDQVIFLNEYYVNYEVSMQQSTKKGVMKTGNRAADALSKVQALRRISHETGADTSRAQKFVLNGLNPIDQIWVIQRLDTSQENPSSTGAER